MEIITIVNKQIRDLLTLKEEEVKKGRKSSGRLEIIERKIEENKKKQRKHTEACEPKEVIARGDALKNKIEAELKELEEIGNEVQALKIAAIPQRLKDEYEALKKERDAEEETRNKHALKVQKIKDKVIPMIQKEAAPHITNEYDDIESAQIRGEKILVRLFNHLEDWKKSFQDRKEKVGMPKALAEAGKK